jgi:hypothetical protein
MKRVFRVMLGLALLLCAVMFPLLAAAKVVNIYENQNSDPLTIYVSSDLSTQISYQSKWQVNPQQQLADSGFFVFFPDSGTVYGPDFASHSSTLVPVFPTAWTQEGQDNEPGGNGNSGDPWTVTTTVRSAGSEVRVVQTISYANNEEEANLSWTITNISGGDLNCVFTHAVAMYMQGDGNAFGYNDPDTGTVGGYNQAMTWYEELTPLSPAPDAFEVSDYGTIWGNIIGDPAGTGQGLQNDISGNYTQLAAALQWNVTPLADGAQRTITERWKVGPNVPPIPSPTPPPPPPAPPGVVITLNSTTLTAGDQLTVDVTVQPVDQRFDAYAVIIGGGAKYSMALNKPGQLRGGLHPLITGVKRLGSQFSGRLLDMQIPSGVTGTFQVIVGLVPSGQKPSVRTVIPGYLDQKTVTVQ